MASVLRGARREHRRADRKKIHLKCKLTWFSACGFRPAEAPGKTSKTSSPTGPNGSRSPQAHIRLRTPCRHKNTPGLFLCGGGGGGWRGETGREKSWSWTFEFTHLFPSLMPLSAVVPSLLTKRRRLLSGKTQTQKRQDHVNKLTQNPLNRFVFWFLNTV